MKNSLAGQIGAMIIAASLVSSTSIAGVPQAQQQGGQQPSSQTSSQQQSGAQPGNTPPSQQPSAPSSGTPSSGTATPGTTPAGTTPSGTTQPGSAPAENQQQGAVQQADQPIEQPNDPNVKAGSKQDVSAIGNRSVGHGLNFYSLEHEIQLGKQLSAEIERQAKFINDPVVNEYVNRVGQNLVRNSDAQVPFTIKGIDSDVVNAMALPGGFFYVNSGLILAADEEAEMAGVMAHEIAHVAACHYGREMTRAQLMQMASIPLIFIGGGIGYGAYEASGLAIPMTFLKFSRTFEAQADYLGVQYMYRSGYDPSAFVSFFEKIQAMEKKKPGTLSKAFDTHPQTPDRIEKTQEEIRKILPSKPEYIVTTSEFDEVKGRLASIENRHKVLDQKDANKPSLRRTSAGSDGNTGNGQTDDDRPTLKRRDDSSSN